MKHRTIGLCFVLLGLFLADPLSAQQPQQFTPTQQAAANLGQQIGLLVQQTAELQTQVQQLTAQLAEKDKRIKVLEDKYEPKEPPK